VADTKRVLAEGRDGPQVLLGDLNGRPDAPELAPLWGEFTDAWAAVNDSGGETFPADVPDRRIDYVAVSAGVEVTSCEVPEALASDHRPVVADLVVPSA
jgi:endonuclease/exonuclease/phosphatase family metal-dependent hydrolase